MTDKNITQHIDEIELELHRFRKFLTSNNVGDFPNDIHKSAQFLTLLFNIEYSIDDLRGVVDKNHTPHNRREQQFEVIKKFFPLKVL